MLVGLGEARGRGPCQPAPVREGFLRAEDGPDLEDAPQVGHERHLLVKLRRLRELDKKSTIRRYD